MRKPLTSKSDYSVRIDSEANKIKVEENTKCTRFPRLTCNP